MKKTIAFHRPFIGKEEEKAVVEVLRSGWLTKGPKTVEFETFFSSFIGTEYAVGLNSCTAGLHLALLSMGVGKGDEVITSALTFAATANVIVHTGARVVFADVDWKTGNIDPSDAVKKITSRTKAIIAVHLAGHPCDMDELRAISRKKKIKIIEDAAHGLGAVYKNKNVGTLGDAAVFSFYATKNITTGEGGMLTTNNKKLAEQCRVLSLHGLSSDAWKRYTPAGNVFYSIADAGYKYNMFDIQAALGIEQLKRVPALSRKRDKLWALYNSILRDVPELEVPYIAEKTVHAKHLYVIKINTKKLNFSRDILMDKLRKKGIYTQVHFIPLHLQPLYKKLCGLRKKDLPVTSGLFESILSLPFYPQMKEEDVLYVADTIKKIIKQSQ